MNIKKISNIADIIIILISIILILFIAYDVYLFVRNTISKENTPPKNSIQVSPFEINSTNTVSGSSTYKVYYKGSSLKEIPTLKNSDIVSIDMDCANNKISALFFNKAPEPDNTMSLITFLNKDDSLNLSFFKDNNYDKYSYYKQADNILITDRYTLSDLFIYDGEFYQQYQNKSMQKAVHLPLQYSNIIIKNSPKNLNKIYVFTGGFVKEYNPSDKLFLKEGKTILINMCEASCMSYKYSDIIQR